MASGENVPFRLAVLSSVSLEAVLGLCGVVERVLPVRYERGNVHCMRVPRCFPLVWTWIRVMFPRVVSHVVAVVITAGMLVPGPDLALPKTSSILMYLLDRGDCSDSVSALRFIDSVSDIVSLLSFLLNSWFNSFYE